MCVQVSDALSKPFPDRLQFVLGTESGMITSIVRKVRLLCSCPPLVDMLFNVCQAMGHYQQA